MATFEQFIDALGRAFPEPHPRGVAFERACAWLLTHHPVYAARLEQVWHWKDWPGRWGPDCGIDLVARDRDGLIWAIQAKCYAADQAVTKRDLDAFLSESIHETIDRRLLIATTDHLAANARRVVRQQDKVRPIATLLRSGLKDAPLHWPEDPRALTGGKARERWSPRRHQQEAIEAVRSSLGERGQLIMACGTGKTLTALWAAEALEARRTLVLLPSLTLLSQTVSEWLTHAGTPFAFLPVCSDDTVAEKDDAAMAFTTDLAFPVTTDPAQIHHFLAGEGSRVVFATYQSSQRVAEAFAEGGLAPFDLVIADEAHRCAGKVSSDYGTVLDAEALPASRRLFMTATPVRAPALDCSRLEALGARVQSRPRQPGPVSACLFWCTRGLRFRGARRTHHPVRT